MICEIIFLDENEKQKKTFSFEHGVFIVAKNLRKNRIVACSFQNLVVDKNVIDSFFAKNGILKEDYGDFKIIGEPKWIAVVSSILKQAKKTILN